jgi:hypothetical protein
LSSNGLWPAIDGTSRWSSTMRGRPCGWRALMNSTAMPSSSKRPSSRATSQGSEKTGPEISLTNFLSVLPFFTTVPAIVPVINASFLGLMIVSIFYQRLGRSLPCWRAAMPRSMIAAGVA